jgi:hypothetical protein
MPSVHVLVDLENNQPTLDDVRRLVPDLTDAWLFHGPRQVAHLSSYAPLGSRHTAVPLARPGRNALDFQLAFYLGYIAARNQGDKLVVVAIDNDYAPLIEHANHLGINVTKVAFKPTATAGRKKTSAKKATAKKKTTAKKARAKKSPPVKKVVAKKAAVKKAAAPRKPPVAKPPAAKPKLATPVKATSSKNKAAPAKTASAKVPPKKKLAPANPAPARAAPKAKPPAPQLGVDKVIANLRKMGDRRPKKLKQFQRYLKSLLGQNATDDAAQTLLANLLAANALRVSGDAVDYTTLAPPTT